MQFRILGAIQAGASGTAVDLGPPKQRALLAILLLHVGEIVPTDRLIDLLWGDSAPRTAGHSIQIYVSELRKALQPLGRGPLIVTRPPGYALDASPEEIDAQRFSSLVERGLSLTNAGDKLEGGRILRSALELWRGPALSDFVYEEFAQPYIRRLNDEHLDAIEGLAAAELEMSRSTESLSLLQVAVREDPLRERSRELLMLTLYRAGRHAEALRNYQQLRELLNEEMGLEPSPQLRRLQERILLHDPTLLPAAEATAADVHNPYKGLRPFGEDDAEDFFGRDALVNGLIDRLRRGQQLISLVGPSGAGKSSVVAAGLIPRLKQGAIAGSDEWLIATIVPGADPLAEAEAAIARIAPATTHGPRGSHPDEPLLRAIPDGGHALLVVDQFEEVFGGAEDSARARFLSAVARATAVAGNRLTIVLTLRADYYDRPLLDSDFAAEFLPSVVNVLPMRAHEFEAAVVKPAERVGMTIETSLLAELVADAAGRAGGLPLLQYALTELFEQRTGAELTHSAYRSLGGLRGVLSRRAEALYEQLEPAEQRAVVQVFLRLVRLAESTVESRRRLRLAQLEDLVVEPVTLSKVLDLFGRHRLLSFDRDALTGEATVEVAHEALFREWGRLANWIDRHRTSLWRRDVLAMAVEEWELSGRDPDYLLSGSRLAEFDAWQSESPLQLTRREREFLNAGLERRRQQHDEEQRLAREQHRLRHRARWGLAGLAGGLVLLVLAASFAVLGAGPPAPSVALLHQGTGGFVDRIMRETFVRSVTDLGLEGREHFHTPVADAEDDLRREVWMNDLRRVSQQGNGLIMAFDMNALDVAAVARDFPQSHYVTQFVADAPNMIGFRFNTHEGSYLAGAAAAMKSSSGVIGFIGGVDIPLIWSFQAGYEAGARAVNPDVSIITVYLSEFGDDSGFNNRVKAYREATEMYRQGADVIFQAAGASGPGVFEAAATMSSTTGRHVWAIGVDEDQYETITHALGVIDAEAWRRHILTSVVLRHDRAVVQILEDYARGELRPGRRLFDLASGLMELSYSGGYIDDIRPELEVIRAAIANGELPVYCYPADKEAMVQAYMQANPGGWELESC